MYLPLPAAGRRWVLIPLLAVLLAACPGSERATGAGRLERDVFIDVMVELRRARSDAASADEFEERRAEILERYDLEADDLLAFVERHGHNVALMHQVWDSVQARLQRGPDETEEEG
jgi:hypothetical protein